MSSMTPSTTLPIYLGEEGERKRKGSGSGENVASRGEREGVKGQRKVTYVKKRVSMSKKLQ